MSFISYAQNFEDIMLWRALKHIEKGFYIDAGAMSPDVDSVTRLFYENGWKGINLEPSFEFIAELKEKRSNDINLCVAVSNVTGIMEMNFLDNPGLSTLNNEIAQNHSATGLTINKQPVEVTTLTRVWNSYVPPNQDVHFLKVDVEGLEEAVLRGNDWQQHRPWVVVVEATLPMTQEESYNTWENILLSANYQFVYADGLNRFYVAQEHSELLPAFNYPPNVFDDFILHTQQQGNERAQQAEAQIYQANERAQQAEAQIYQANERAQQAEAQIYHANERARQAEAQIYQANERAQQAEVKAKEAKAQIYQANERAQQATLNAEQAEAQIYQANERAQQATLNAEQAEAQIYQANERAQQAEVKAKEAKAQIYQANERAQQAEDKAKEAKAQAEHERNKLKAVFNSKSWRITWPLRKLTQIIKWLFALPIHATRWLIHLPKYLSHWFLVMARNFISMHPQLKGRLKFWLQKSPRLFAKLSQKNLQTTMLNQPHKPSQSDGLPLTEPIEAMQSDVKSKIIEASDQWIVGRRIDA